MTQQRRPQATDAATKTGPADREERRAKVVEQGESAAVASIADAIVLKSGEPFFLCDRDGQVPIASFSAEGPRPEAMTGAKDR